VWTFLVVILPPSFDLSPRITQTGEPVRVQTFIPQPAIEAFCVGVLYRLAWLDELQPHPVFFAPGRQARLRNSGPLSKTIASGSPRSLAIRSSTRRTRNPPSEVSTSMAGHSRVQSSTTVNMRITLPLLTQSFTKSIDLRSFGLAAAGLVTTPLQRIRRRCRILIAKPSSRYNRYTRLWLAGIPSRTSSAVSRR
jgi:hypothetical protein